MTRELVLGILIGALGFANADDAAPSRELARKSTTLFLGTTWTPGPTVPIRIGAEAALRVQRAHLAFEVRFGAGGAGSLNALGSVFGGHVGGGLGAALPLGAHVVITPMFGYDVFAMFDVGGAAFLVHHVTFDLPLAIVLRRGVAIEVFTQAGVARYNGMTDPALVVGPRIGIVF